MVLEGVLVQVLNHFLRPYVKNLDPSQLKVAIFSGDVLLENLELKENALDDLNLPVRVFRGYLGKLRLKIPWKSLYSSPIVAEIDGLYAIVEPATAFKYDAEKSAKESKERKDKQLKRIEEARKRAAEPKNEKTGQDSGFVERLITAAIRNIQITVKNIHIRYEDSVTNVERPFSFGVTLDSLFVQSTDCEYVVGGTAVDPDPSSMLVYKLLQLNCLAVYWQSDDSLLGTSPPDNWTEILKRGIARPNAAPSNTIHYVVHPITLEARLQATTKPGRKMAVPQALVKVTLHQVALSLSKQQFQDVTSLVESLDRMSINLKFLKYRPVGVRVKEDPRQWWRYAISAVTKEEVRRKMEMWSWKHIQQHRKWCRQYTNSYARKLVAKTITSGLQKELDFLEMKLDVFNLTVCRQLAEGKAAVVKRQEEAEAKKEEGGGGGWWGWAAGWGTSSTEEEKEDVAVTMPTEKELQEEKRRMYEAIGYSDNAQVPIYPKEYVAHSVSVNLEKASVQLWNEDGTLAHVVTSSVTAQVQNRPSSKNITVQTTVGRLTARGFDCGTSGVGGEGPIIVSSKHNEEASLLDLSVDINPVNSTVSQRLKVKLLPIQITYHADTVDAVISMFKPSKDVHLQRLSAAAASTLEELKTQGRSGLVHAIGQRKLLDLDVVLSSPCLVVPESGAIADSSCVLVADLGQLEIKSDLRSYVPDVRGATDAELDEAFYDHFKLSLKRLQVLVAGPGQDWGSAWSSGTSPLHVLEPTSLELELKKSLLPNDTRLPNLRVEGVLPALTLSVSDKKLKQLLQVVQSLPLPPPSLAQQNVQSSSRYSIPDQPSQLGTDSMVENISETLLISPAQPESESSGDEEGFETASECESDEEGVLHHREHETQTAALSTTKLTLHFVVRQVGILFSEHRETSGCDTPRLHLLVTSVTSDLVMRSWDMRLSASIGDLCVVDHYLTGPNGEPGAFLDTQLTDGQKLITFNYSKFDPQAPHYATEFNLTRQTMAASLALLRLKLHSDSLLNLIDISRSITSVLKSADSDEGEEAQEGVRDSVEPSVSSSPSSEGVEQQVPEGERQLQLKVSLAGLVVGLCGGDLGEVMSSSITGIEARVDKFQDYLQVEASVADIVLLDNEPKVHYKKIIEKMDQDKKVISLKITVFNEPACVRDPRDLSLSDMDITADVKRLRVMIIFSFLTRVQRFAMQFLHRLKLDQTTIDSAREAASNTASKTAEALRERSSSRVKLNLIIGAPLLVVPYTPPLSLSPPPSSSSSSPPPPALPSHQRAFVANLGELKIRNVFRLASDVAAEKTAGEQGEKRDQSRFLSSSGCPAVVDSMTVTISSVQLSRVMDVEKAGSELKVTKSDEIGADGHMLLKPLQFNGKITRLLSGWCTALPAVSVSCKLKRTQMQFSPQDYHDVMCVLQDTKTMNQKEESAVEVAATEGKPEEEKKETAVEEKAVVKVEGKGEGEGSSTGGVTVHVEADVESLELLLCSHVGEVAEIKIKGAATSVDMLNDKVAIKARISGVEVFDCTPGVLYHKIVSVEENCLAVEAWVDYFSNATKGEGAYDTSKCDLSVKLSVNRIRIVALYLFVSRVLNYIQQLHDAQKQDHDDLFGPQDTQGLDETQAVQKTQGSKPGVPMRIKLAISVEAPEITMPLNSKSCDVVVLDLGQFSLTNGFLGLDVGFSKDKSIALYEQHHMELKDLKLYRSVWDGESNKHSDCQRDILKPVSLTVEIHRNLSADWYHGMPTLSIDAKLNPLLVVASGDDIESVCLILLGNLKESCPSDVDTGSGNVGRSFSAGVAEDRQPIDSLPGTVPEDTTDSSEQPFTELLISARMKTIGLKLYFKDHHPLTCEDKSTWEREGTREFAEISLEGLQAGVKRESNGATSVSVSLDDCMLDDLRTRLNEDRETADEEEEDEEGSTRESSVDVVAVPKKEQPELRIRRMIEKRAFDKEPSKHLISLEYNLTPDNSTNIVTAINGIQVLVNLKFIEALTVFLLESIKPLQPDKPVNTEEGEKEEEQEEEEEKDKDKGREDTAPHHEVASSLSRTQSMEKESKMSISVKVTHPLVALLEDARQPYSPALVCQMEVCVNLTRKLPSNCASLSGSLSRLSLSVARYPNLEMTILKPVLGPLSDKVLVYMDQWDGVTKISATVPSLELVLSPATVRIVLNSINSLSSGQAEEHEMGETAPANLWTSRSITRGRLRKKWYLRDSEPSDHLAPSISHLTTHFSTVSSAPSQRWNESFELEVANITVVVEQEVATPSLRTFPAISMAMGKYSSTALTLQLRDWSSKLKVSTELHLEVAYYNIRNDSWEPILEPIVDPRNRDRYISWSMKATVVRQPPSHSKHLEDAGILGEVEEEDREEGEEEVNLSVDVWAESALQLTLTKSSLNIFSQLVQAYTEKKAMVVEEVDTPETYGAAFTVVNKLGKDYPVTVKPAHTLKVHGAYSPVLRQGDSALPLHPTEGVVKMKPGELLPRDSHLSRVHILQLLIAGFAALDVALGMYERVYYPLVPQSSTSTAASAGGGEREKGGSGVVVDIDRTAGAPVVTLRSPLQVHNHLDQPVTVHHSLSHTPPPLPPSPPTGSETGGVALVPPDSLVPLPLSASRGGFLFFQLPHTGLSQPPVQWREGKSLDICCSVTRSEARVGGARGQQKFSFVHTAVEEEEYSRSPSVPLSQRAHHLVHLHQPLVVHNLLPYSLSLGEEGHSMVLIASGSQAHISYTKLSQTKKFLVEVQKKDKRWSGSFMMGSKSDEETVFTVSHESCSLELLVKKEEKGAWQLSVCSRNWMVNKTGLTLQYRAPEGFFSFGQKPTEVYMHDSKSAISLYPHEEVCVRVVKGDRYSEWSNKFSLETLGSEGIFTCSFKNPPEELQIGTKVDLANFGTTRVLTLSPFYMINNSTRDSVSFRECSRSSSKVSTIVPGQLLPFWPSAGSKSLEISVGDETMRLRSSPLTFTETASLLVRTRNPQVPAVMVEVQVTGSANIITFTPYYSGCVPLQLVNHTEYHLPFKQIDGPCVYQLEPKQSLMYSWDLPLGEKVLLLLTNRLDPKVNGSGNFFLSEDSIRSGSGSVEGDSLAEETHKQQGEEEEEEEEEGKEEEEEGEEEGEEVAVGQEVTQYQGGTGEVDFSLPKKLRRLSDEVKKSVGRTSQKDKRRRKKRVYWISFMDSLQRVLLLTSSHSLVKSVSSQGGTTNKEPPHTELSLSLIGTGLSLVDDLRGQEVTYIGIPQSQKEWQIRVKKLWKALPHDVSDKLEKLHNSPSSQKTKGRRPIPDSVYEVDFTRMYLYVTKTGSKNRLRRSHFEGVYARVTLSEHLTSVSVRISHVQVDNQLPLTLQPIIMYPYPPPPSIASSCAPKPFIEGTLVIHKTEQSNVSQIQFLQVLVQEVGVNLDMSFLMALLGLFSNLSSNSTEAQIVGREVEYAKLPLRESKVAAVSAAVSRKYFKLLHLSPLIIHLSFSLEMSDQEGKEAKKATETNIFMSMIFNVLLSFATIVGKTKDAELHLRYFELENEALTQQALMDRVQKHYIQEGVIQMYSVVLGLEVLGNPVGFVRGLKKGTVGLFYHPLQGAVLGPEEFMEGVVLGSREFVGGTVGGISGVLGKVTGVLGDTAANLTMDEEFQSQRKRERTRGNVGQSLEGAARGVFAGVTGVISQPIKGAKKEGLLGLVKGAGKGVLGLVLRPTGGLIDLTSATFNAVQRKTKVGNYDITQLRPPRFIGQPKFVSPYSPHKAEGYALFLALENGRLSGDGDIYFDFVELEENPLRNLLVTNNRFLVIKRNAMFDRFEEEEVVMFRDMCGKTRAERSRVVVPVLEEQGWFLSSKKKLQTSSRQLEVPSPKKAAEIVSLVNQAYQEYRTTQTKKSS